MPANNMSLKSVVVDEITKQFKQVEQMNETHIQCCQHCQDFRDDKIEGDLCLEGRRLMQFIYTLDECQSKLLQYLEADSLEEMGKISQGE